MRYDGDMTKPLNTTIIKATSRATNITRTYRVRWAAKSVRCCGQTVVVSTADDPRVYVDGSHGQLRGYVAQCRGCGQNFEACFTAKLVSE